VGKRSKRWALALGLLLLGPIALLLILAGLFALSNRGLPSRSLMVDRLAEREKARLAEARHLRKGLGPLIWPGWDQVDIPVVLYDERYAFLTGYPDPPPGWVKVGTSETRGGPWELVPGDEVEGVAYYRQALTSSAANPEAFTVRVGSRWAASIPTLEWFQIGLARRMREELPAFLGPFFPYRIATGLFIGGSDGYISLQLHEAFHAYQGTLAPDRLVSAQRVTAVEDDYRKRSADQRQAWQEELRLLAAGASATSRDEVRSLATQFLTHRRERRSRHRLSDRLIDYERQREWLEGLAKYAELEAWRRASKTADYQPLPALADDPEFARYAGFDRKWSRELSEMRRSAGREDIRFYYSGMAQAVALDRLMPAWKTRAFADSSWLETLLAEAVAAP